MVRTYIGLLLYFSFRRFVFRTDALEILAAAFLPAAFRALGFPMPEGANNAVLAYIAYGVAALVIIRLLLAPYFVWKEDQNTIDGFKNQLDSPRRIERDRIAEHMATLKTNVSSQVSYLVEIALNYGSVEQAKKELDKIASHQTFLNAAAQELSTEPELSQNLREVTHLAMCVLADKMASRIEMDVRESLFAKSQKLLRQLQSTD